MAKVQILAETEWYSLTVDEASEVVDGYRPAIAELEAAGHQASEGIMLSRGFRSRAVAQAIGELVKLTPWGVSYCLAIRRRAEGYRCCQPRGSSKRNRALPPLPF